MKGLIRPKAKRAWKKIVRIARLQMYKSYPPVQGDLGISFNNGKYYDLLENRK